MFLNIITHICSKTSVRRWKIFRHKIFKVKSKIPAWGADLLPGKRQNFICLNMGFFEKDFSPPGDMLKILIPPWGQECFLENTKIMPLLTREFSCGPLTGPVGYGCEWRLPGMSRQYAQTHEPTIYGIGFCEPTLMSLRMQNAYMSLICVYRYIHNTPGKRDLSIVQLERAGIVPGLLLLVTIDLPAPLDIAWHAWCSCLNHIGARHSGR